MPDCEPQRTLLYIQLIACSFPFSFTQYFLRHFERGDDYHGRHKKCQLNMAPGPARLTRDDHAESQHDHKQGNYQDEKVSAVGRLHDKICNVMLIIPSATIEPPGATAR
jgi:hypothetical protein